jgi:hypothetical protein
MFNEHGSFLLAVFEFFLFFAWFMCLFWVLSGIFRSVKSRDMLIACSGTSLSRG